MLAAQTDFFSKFLQKQEVELLCENLNTESLARIRLKGLAGSSRAFVVAAAFLRNGATSLIVMNDKEEAAFFYNDLAQFLESDKLFFFPSSYKRSVQYKQILPEATIQRTDVLNSLSSISKPNGVPAVIVSYPDALSEKVVTNAEIEQNTLGLSVGEKISTEFLIEVLYEYGFTKTEFVYEPGQFSQRGSIIDIFSFASADPFRIDFFGDEVESIRSFDVDDQLSKGMRSNITITPNLNTDFTSQNRCLLTESLPPQTIVWINDLEIVISRMNEIQAFASEQEGSVESLDFASGADFFRSAQNFPVVEFGIKQQLKSSLAINFNTSPQPSFSKNFELLAENLVENADKGYRTYILAPNPAQHQRLENIFESVNRQATFTPVEISLHEGFIDHDLMISLYTDHQIFERYHKYKLKHELSKTNSLSLQELMSLQVGDFVVHIDHGIGTFGGLVKTEVNGKVQEAVRLIYKDNDTLLVSIHNLHRISKYRGKDAEAPKVYKLGSGAWQRLKQNTKKKVKDIAKELIALYAKRKAEKGFSFSPDTYLQEELEASFIYEDTPDQEKATVAVKDDMQSGIPMDRLVCGDVGFGKTEVAVRAAFKAVADSKQVAVLVPTTILALQHFQTFKQRLSSFPCTVDYVSRMKSAKQQKETLARLAEGKVDIIIGTHALLGSAVKFKDLGLMIVDEEQKFGVAAKEKLKRIRVNVDTLTLTATPIPRTLQFSLMGARDLSIINTPPPNRHPIATELHTFNTAIIKEAIEYEVSRGGQVFFVHNRVQNIAEVQQMLLKVCPNVTSVVAHGQMEPAKLEKTMLDFICGDYDVLISTTIIESGLDIPNANTIIVNNAQMFGLSDLHQLRGRVGRSNKKAFCYLLAPPLETLTSEARRRLKALEEFSELGSGFSIAMQDLDIRGAGNMLGAEQSGFINEIGFETYHKILDEAIQELKHEEFSELFADEAKETKDGWDSSGNDCHIETDLELLLPDSYISSIPERMRLYREIDLISNTEELEKFRQKLTDRFGAIPSQVEELLNVVTLKWRAISVGIEKIVLKNGILIAYFISNQLSPFYRSNVFSSIIMSIQSNQHIFQLKETNDRLSLTAKNVENVDNAITVLQHLTVSSR
ncbi:MAG TPA: transcription-repair coupling factor [Tenuifilaceae bacterium]|nr:transcription-repair coupling factor [Tenuifilaceae bacterium]HPE17629.1 transcription-repair coupling factor [Tenuifilaceae bacterium]HPJ44968.1 transcription-repair coupling factor [Tenuifilaceae bacterium]HPQ33785.1 transcription-repair coupling factor [Tenuifilaceae bacterium]HRX67677.1 transcription-repair coupling factor [Tenuifilaceae bacterium]